MKKKLEQALAEYSASHRHPVNKRIHWVCVPLIVLTTLGLLLSLPFPGGTTLVLNWATVLSALFFIYYLTLSVSHAMAMAAFCVLFIAATWSLGEYRAMICWTLFIASWIFQFLGHEIEKKRPSFLKDLQFLAIGPLWILRAIGVR